MTVITMPTSDKKSDVAPLVTNIEVDPAATQAKDLEAGNFESNRPVRSKYLVLRVINDRFYNVWTLLYALLMTIFITFMLLYGSSMIRALKNVIYDEKDIYYGTGTIALNDKLTLPMQDTNNDYEMNQFKDVEFKELENFALNLEKMNNPMTNPEDIISEFKENYELDLKEDNYEKIYPVVPTANSARFIHDFSTNITGIVDVVGKQCFIMPLNRSSVLPPKSLYDLLFKMSSGYYAVDTKSVMHNMRVVKPAIKDLTQYGLYIAKDCAGFPTYKLEKIVSGVFKRNAPTGRKIFSEFAGNMDSFHIVNYYEIDLQ